MKASFALLAVVSVIVVGLVEARSTFHDLDSAELRRSVVVMQAAACAHSCRDRNTVWCGRQWPTLVGLTTV